jgi:hypothetical protein
MKMANTCTKDPNACISVKIFIFISLFKDNAFSILGTKKAKCTKNCNNITPLARLNYFMGSILPHPSLEGMSLVQKKKKLHLLFRIILVI